MAKHVTAPNPKPKKDKNVSRMRKASGEVNSTEMIVGFLYLLMRDSVTPGKIEQIMLELSNAHDYNKSEYFVTQYTNGWLATYAKDIAKRLMSNKKTLRQIREHNGQNYNRNK